MTPRALPVRTAHVAGRVVGIRAVDEDTRLDAPLYAINWFNARRPRVYDLYNLLAAPAVGRVGGRGHLKAHRERTLEGDPTRARDTLLVVSYPSADAFLRMVRNPWFQAISPLREAGVSDFVFGFTARRDAGPAPRPRPDATRAGRVVLVHHFEVARGVLAESHEALARAAEDVGARLHYAGETAARLAVGRGTPDRVAPFFMDGIVLVDAPREDALHAFRKSAAHAALRARTRADYLGVFRRVW